MLFEFFGIVHTALPELFVDGADKRLSVIKIHFAHRSDSHFEAQNMIERSAENEQQKRPDDVAMGHDRHCALPLFSYDAIQRVPATLLHIDQSFTSRGCIK